MNVVSCIEVRNKIPTAFSKQTIFCSETTILLESFTSFMDAVLCFHTSSTCNQNWTGCFETKTFDNELWNSVWQPCVLSFPTSYFCLVKSSSSDLFNVCCFCSVAVPCCLKMWTPNFVFLFAQRFSSRNLATFQWLEKAVVIFSNHFLFSGRRLSAVSPHELYYWARGHVKTLLSPSPLPCGTFPTPSCSKNVYH